MSSPAESFPDARQAVERATARPPSRALMLEVLGVIAFTCLATFLRLHILGPAPITAGRLWLRVPADLGVLLVLCALLGGDYRPVWSLPKSREGWWDEFGWGLALFVVEWLLALVAWVGFWAFDVGPPPSVVDPIGLNAAMRSPGVAWSFYLTLPLVCAYEEVLFRVYLQTRLTTLFRGQVVPAILTASALFITVHYYGFRQSLLTGLWGALSGWIFYRSGRLPRLVIAHVLFDVSAQM